MIALKTVFGLHPLPVAFDRKGRPHLRTHAMNLPTDMASFCRNDALRPEGGAMTQVAGVENNGSFWQRMLWGTKIRVGVVNAFDRRPPTVLGAFNDNYDTSLYSIRNRYYYVGLNKKF